MNSHPTEAQRIRLLTSDDIVAIMQKILRRESRLRQRHPNLQLKQEEQFWMIGLSEDWKLLFVESMGWGLLEEVMNHPTEVFSFALQKKARHLILCHHKLEALLQPSAVERDTTDRLIQVGKIINTPIWDHLIISADQYTSFKAEGLMEELEAQSNYAPSQTIQERLQQQLLAIGEKNGRLDVAKELKRRGMPADIIAEITKLSIQEINDLEV
jgi:DNA repair protein RadC